MAAGARRSVATLLSGDNKLFLHDLQGLAMVLDRWCFSHLDSVSEDFQGLLDDAGALAGSTLNAVGLRRVLLDIDETDLAKEVTDHNVERRVRAHPRPGLRKRVCSVLVKKLTDAKNSKHEKFRIFDTRGKPGRAQVRRGEQ